MNSQKVMKKEIGSIFEIDEKKYGEDDKLETGVLKEYYGEVAEYYEFVASGREAIAFVLQDIRKRQKIVKKVCFLPMYTCDTVIIPFQDDEWNIIFYPINKDLSVQVTEFSTLLKKYQPLVVLIHNYYGVDTNKGIRELLKKKQKDGLIVIEDNTQDFVKATTNFCADYYVMSLRKWFHITDGAMIAAKFPLLHIRMKERENFINAKWHALTEKNFYLANINDSNFDEMQNLKQKFLKENLFAERLLYEDSNIYGISKLSKYLFNNIDINKSLKQRAANAKIIYENLSGLQSIRLPLIYSGKEVPLYVPIYVENRQKVQDYMRTHNIFIPILWPIPEQLSTLNKDVEYIYSHLLALPCDGRYGEKDMVYMCDLLKKRIV